MADALPGERVEAAIGGGKSPARLLRRLAESPDRRVPACRHFGRCGGCVLQHLADAPYAALKRRLVLDALARQGVNAGMVLPTLVSPPGSRRRTRLEARRRGGGAVLGFHERSSDALVDIAECPILVPGLAQLLPTLRVLMTRLLLPGAKAAISLAWTAAGADLGLLLPAAPRLEALEAMAEFAAAADLARLWWRCDGAPVPAAVRRLPVLDFGGVPVSLPPDGFFQATADGEAALVAAATVAVDGAGRLVDLFAGSGTFSLPLARTHAIHAVEGDAAALAALGAGGRAARLTRLTTEHRDLEKRPLLAQELDRYDAILFDPPHGGARAQTPEIAKCHVPLVIGISCNPASFARDAKVLATGGYRLDAVQPVDQFLWSSDIELLGVFRQSGR